MPAAAIPCRSHDSGSHGLWADAVNFERPITIGRKRGLISFSRRNSDNFWRDYHTAAHHFCVLAAFASNYTANVPVHFHGHSPAKVQQYTRTRGVTGIKNTSMLTLLMCILSFLSFGIFAESISRGRWLRLQPPISYRLARVWPIIR